MVFQSFNLFPHLTALGNITLAPRVVKKVPESEAADLGRGLWRGSGSPRRRHSFRTSSPAVSSSGWPLRELWP